MIVVVVGDLHGNFFLIEKLSKKLDSEDIIIQVGDFGVWPKLIDQYPKKIPNRVFFIDGNHEYFPLLKYETITEIKHNLFYVPRGTIMELEGKLFGFVGGGCSIDVAYRTKGVDWFPEEIVTNKDIEPLLKETRKLDYIITHSPPLFVTRYKLGPVNKQSWNLPDSWVDESAIKIEVLYRQVNGFYICGHIHTSVYLKEETKACKILAECEAFALLSERLGDTQNV